MSGQRPLPFDPVEKARRNWEEQGWSAAAPGMALVTSIMRVHQILGARLDQALAEHGLTYARYEVLMLLSFSRSGELPLGKIGERLQVHPASVTNAVTRLENQQLVLRFRHPDDQRARLARITKSGRRLAEAASITLNGEVFGATGLSPPDTERVVGLLGRLRRSAGDFI